MLFNLFGNKEKQQEVQQVVEPAKKKVAYRKNPFLNPNVKRRSFFSSETERVLSGWTTQSSSIDEWLNHELVIMRARSTEAVHRNPFAKRFQTAVKSNIVGPDGVTVQPQVRIRRDGRDVPDDAANNAITNALKDWAQFHCDRGRKLSFIDFQNLAINHASKDGEFIFRIYEGSSKSYGKYGLQLKKIHPELLDTTKNMTERNGNEIRLGVEYNSDDIPVFYHFRKRGRSGSLQGGEPYKVSASQIIHGFINEEADQSRGIPWMHAALERLKHLEKYDETAMVASRVGASKMLLLRSDEGDQYEGDEDEDGEEYHDGSTLTDLNPGEVENIGRMQVESFDPRYPHEMYADFVKATLRSISSGIGVSYHSISNDLEGVNYSSIRAGVLEDREIYRGLQEWFIRSFIHPVISRFIVRAIMNQAILIGNVPLSRPIDSYLNFKYQGRRWAWVDPQKDGSSNDMAIKNRTKSTGDVMREQGNIDPLSTWQEISNEKKIMRDLDILPNEEKQTNNSPEVEDDEKEGN